MKMTASIRGFEDRYYKKCVCYITKNTAIINKEHKYFRFDCMRVNACFVSYMGLNVCCSNGSKHLSFQFNPELLYQM